jgi:hypothetical protein
MRLPRGQLTALVALRWQMVRRPSARLALALVVLALPLLCVAAAWAARALPPDTAFNLALLGPTLYLAFVGLAVLAPLTAGGGNELYPSEQLTAFPIRPHTWFAASLLLAPLNLAWAAQVIALAFVTSLVTNGAAGPLPGMATLVLFILAMTILGQAIAWTVIGMRATRTGRVAVWALAGLLTVSVILVVRTGMLTVVLDASPTREVFLGAIAGSGADWPRWARVSIALVLLALCAAFAGARATSWALRRPVSGGSMRDGRLMPRRPPSTSPATQLLAIDRASVWRSASLRRGIVVLGVLPGLVAALAELPWTSLVLVPGLVAAGAGLLFGINAFCLDGSGSLWLSSIPGWSHHAYWAKARVTAECVGTATLVSLGAAVVRAPAPASATQVVAVLGSAASCAALVVAACMRHSVRRPHKADLRGPRDTPAPPGTMAVYSARLALGTTLTGLLFSLLALAPEPWLPAVAAVPFVARAGLSLTATERDWAQPGTRARVVTTVAAG